MTISEKAWPSNIVVEKSEKSGKSVLWYLTDAQLVKCRAALQPPAGVNEGELPDEICVAVIDGELVVVHGRATMKLYQEKYGAVKYTRANGKVEGDTDALIKKLCASLKYGDHVSEDDRHSSTALFEGHARYVLDFLRTSPTTSQPDDCEKKIRIKALLDSITPENVHTEQEAWGTQPDVDVLVKALNHIAEYVHNYCVIIHPKADTKGLSPEEHILKVIDDAITAHKDKEGK
jgi:hypothetical protein